MMRKESRQFKICENGKEKERAGVIALVLRMIRERMLRTAAVGCLDENNESHSREKGICDYARQYERECVERDDLK